MVSLFARLLAFQFLGELFMRIFTIGIPGPVIGMLLMLIFLFVKHDEAEKLAPACHRLLNHLALFFIPAAAGLMTKIETLHKDWFAIAIALVVSTLASIIVTAGVLHRFSK